MPPTEKKGVQTDLTFWVPSQIQSVWLHKTTWENESSNYDRTWFIQSPWGLSISCSTLSLHRVIQVVQNWRTKKQWWLWWIRYTNISQKPIFFLTLLLLFNNNHIHNPHLNKLVFITFNSSHQLHLNAKPTLGGKPRWNKLQSESFTNLNPGIYPS